MSDSVKSLNNSAFDLTELMKRKAPEMLDLLTANDEIEFEDAFLHFLDYAVRSLEANRSHYKALAEEGLTAVFGSTLGGPGISVTQETHINGHVDLVISVGLGHTTRVKLAEAKIYDGPQYHIDGITQLLGRYTTGRELPGLILNYVRKKDIAGITTKLKNAIDNKKPESLIGHCAKHTLKWSFKSEHKHSSGENLELSHIGINLFVE